MGLVEYKKKRRFNETPEPKGKLKKVGSKRLEFVIQKHHASRLHYDFRLELDGVLKSWAVPKGPSLNPGDKRLAMQVEDHPFEYRKFEGVIPNGNYGAGKVIIWDRGWYELHREDDDWPATLKEGLKKGDLKFILHGEKLNGSFALIKTPHMGENAWLLIKHKDEYVSKEDITKKNKSVVSGKDVEDMGENNAHWDSNEKSKLKIEDLIKDAPKRKILRNVKPMLATLVKDPFDSDDWLYEIKWDGYRAVAAWDGKNAELYSRNGLDFSQRYSGVTDALKSLTNQVILDGEIVAVDDNGYSHFEWLQNWSMNHEGLLTYYVFDILWSDGYDLRQLPLIRRKEILKQVLPKSGNIRYSDHIVGQGKAFFATAAKQGLEGIMAKRASSPYLTGTRSFDWQKIKTHKRQEVVIGGYTEPKGSRKYIGSLLAGVYENGNYIYVGHVSGMPPSQLKDLHDKLKKLEVKESPFANKVRPNAPVHWAKPKLVGEVNFEEWTKEGMMRQPILVGLRPDKSPKDVHREVPKK